MIINFLIIIQDNYAYLLITTVVKDAEQRLYLQVQDEEKKIIPGLTKELLINLLKDNDICLCGNCLDSKARGKIEEWKGYFPPTSYKSTYDKFRRNAVKYSRNYKADVLLEYLKDILNKKSIIRETEEAIAGIDISLGGVSDIDNLLEERKQLETDVKDLEEKISQNNTTKGGFIKDKSARERYIASAEKAGTEADDIQRKIDILTSVGDEIKNLLTEETREYSYMLKKEIQNLIDLMLTSKREVQLSEDFQLQVKDSYGDESKSEGQFAVISFAYIGGILKVLKSYKKLADKEYPLILDGPFSKLDDEQKRNVATIIPQYAPQVIIFSKDPLKDFIDERYMGKTWTIMSNEEKNNAIVEEGDLWN